MVRERRLSINEPIRRMSHNEFASVMSLWVFTFLVADFIGRIEKKFMKVDE